MKNGKKLLSMHRKPGLHCLHQEIKSRWVLLIPDSESAEKICNLLTDSVGSVDWSDRYIAYNSKKEILIKR